MKDKVKTYSELVDKAAFILKSRPIEIDSDAGLFIDEEGREMLDALTPNCKTLLGQGKI